MTIRDHGEKPNEGIVLTETNKAAAAFSVMIANPRQDREEILRVLEQRFPHADITGIVEAYAENKIDQFLANRNSTQSE